MKNSFVLSIVVFLTLNIGILNLNSFAQYSNILYFEGVTNGSWPKGSLYFDGTFLYGMTQAGGTGSSQGLGVIFKIKPDGTEYSKLLDFDGTLTGSHPNGSFISDGTYLYGTTYDGGAPGIGTIFKIMPDGTGFSVLYNFNYNSGWQPSGTLFLMEYFYMAQL